MKKDIKNKNVAITEENNEKNITDSNQDADSNKKN